MSTGIIDELQRRMQETCGKPIVQGFPCALRPNHDGPCSLSIADMAKVRRYVQAAAVCTMCGKGEGDGTGPIVFGICPGCQKAWG